MADLLLDSDVLIDVLRGARRLALETNRASYSQISRAELFAGHAHDEPQVRQLLSLLRGFDVDAVIAERAGRLARTGIAVADALIAATAIEHDVELVTRNVRDFTGIPDLRLRDPATLAGT